MGLLEELKDRADKLDAELLALSGRIREIEIESNDVHACINALDLAEMDAEDAEDATTVFDEGRLAYHEGRPGNPYRLGTPEGDAWHDGFVSEADEARIEKEAIAALTPAPAPAQEGDADVEANAIRLPPPVPFLTEMMAKGGTWHDGGPNPAPGKFVDIYVPARESNMGDQDLHLEGQPSDAYVWTRWEVAYRVLPSEPASEAPHAEGYAPVMGEGEQSTSDEIFERDLISDIDPLSISASETHAAESDAVKGDLPPLFPPEPPKAATVEEMADAGIISGDAYWLSRKIAKELA